MKNGKYLESFVEQEESPGFLVDQQKLNRQKKDQRKLSLLQQKLENDENLKRIDIRDFKGIHSQKVQQEDEREIRHLESVFKNNDEENKIPLGVRLSDLLETILLYHIQYSQWLGPNVDIQRSSVYDDYKNGIDCIVSFSSKDPTEKKILLGLDITSGSYSTLKKKVQRACNEIKDGKLGYIKYFQMPYGNSSFQGKDYYIPRFVIGVQRSHVWELVHELFEIVFADELHLSEIEKYTKIQKIEKNPLSLLLLEELMMQLQAYIDYATYQNVSSEIIDQYKALYPLLESQYHRKRSTTQAPPRDGVVECLGEICQEKSGLDVVAYFKERIQRITTEK